MKAAKVSGPARAMRSTRSSVSGVWPGEPMGSVGLHLRVAGEHLDHVVVQAVVELPLEVPAELGAVDLPRPQGELVDVDRRRGILEADFDDGVFPLGPHRKIEQRMLVLGELPPDRLDALAHGAAPAKGGPANNSRMRFSRSPRPRRKNSRPPASLPVAWSGSGRCQASRSRRAGSVGQAASASEHTVIT